MTAPPPKNIPQTTVRRHHLPPDVLQRLHRHAAVVAAVHTVPLPQRDLDQLGGASGGVEVNICGLLIRALSGAFAGSPPSPPPQEPLKHPHSLHTHSYLIQERAKGSAGDWQDQSGLRDYWGRAKAAMNKYLSLAPADDVQGVRCVFVCWVGVGVWVDFGVGWPNWSIDSMTRSDPVR